MGRYPWAEVILSEVLYIIVFYPTRQRAYRVVVFAAMIYVAAQIYSTPEVTDPLTVTYVVGCLTLFHLAFAVYILLAEGSFPDRWRRVRNEVHAKADTDGLYKLPSGLPLTEKLWWMVVIAYSPCMIGWVQEPRISMPPHPPPSRRKFLQKTLKLITNTAVVDFTGAVFALSPAFDYRLHDPTDGPEPYPAAVPFLRRIPYILSYGITSEAGVGVLHNTTALVYVGLGYSSPTLWPDVWGRRRDVYTLRKLWGCVHR